MESENKENTPPPTAVAAPAAAPTPGPDYRPAHRTRAAIAPVAAVAPTTSYIQRAATASTNPTTPAPPPARATMVKNETLKSEQTSENPVTKFKIYRQRYHAKNSTQKHAPISPRNTVILFKDNPELDKTPLKKGVPQPEKLKLNLVDTKGNIHKRFFPEKDEEKWDDTKWISECNKWRNQVLRRMLKHDPTWQAQGIRPKWGMRETNALKAEVEKKVKAVGNRRLTGQEWEEVTNAHNKRFAGDTLRVGERLLGGDVSKSAQEIQKRTMISIKSLFERNKGLKAFFCDLVTEIAEVKDGDNNGVVGGSGDVEIVGDSQEDEVDMDTEVETDTDDESPSKKKRKIDRHGGELDARLEDPSDDEDENQRPASTQNGARLIACT